MRTVTLPNSTTIEVRGLKRKELKNLEDFGYRRSRFTPPDVSENPDAMDESVDAVLDLVLTKKDQTALEDCEPRYTSEVWLAAIKETYGAADEVKN